MVMHASVPLRKACWIPSMRIYRPVRPSVHNPTRSSGECRARWPPRVGTAAVSSPSPKMSSDEYAMIQPIARKVQSPCPKFEHGWRTKFKISRTKFESGSSSSYINKTTTTPTEELSNFVQTGEDSQPLVYPSRLCENHRDIAASYLSALAPEQRQPILDELEGRFRAEAKGMKPVYDEISFLHSLCKRMRQGKFLPNLGIKVRDGRRERAKTDPNASEDIGATHPGRPMSSGKSEKRSARRRSPKCGSDWA